MESAGSKGSGSEDDPLVPDDFDDAYFKNLLEKVPEITKVLRQKDTQDNSDNVQRLVICGNRYKSDLHICNSRANELSEDKAGLENRVENLTRLNRLDQDTIAELRGVIESAWKQKDAAQMREQITQDELIKLREKIEELEEAMKHLTDKRSELQSKRDENKEREALKAEIKDLNKRLQIQRLYITEVETMTQTLEEKNRALLKLLEETSSDAYAHKKRIDILQKEYNDLRSADSKKTEVIAQIRATNEHLTKVKVRQNLQVLSLKTNMEHLNTQYNGTCNKLAKITVEMEYVVNERDRVKRELAQRCNLLKLREDEMLKLKQDNGKLAKSQESTARKYASLDEAKRVAEDEQTRLRTQLNTQDKELEAMRRIVHHFEKNNDHLTKERDVLKRDLILEHRTAEENDEQFQESQHEIKSLKETVHQMDMKNKKLAEELNKTRKEKTKKLEEMQTLLDKMDALQNEAQLKENYEIELKRTVTDLEVRCAKQQAQQMALNNEKSSLQRSMQTLEEDKAKLRQQTVVLQAEIETQKGKVSYRDAEISKLQLQLDRMEKERRQLRADVHALQLAHHHTRSELGEKKKDVSHYAKGAHEDELKLAQQRKDLEKIRNEKNAVCVLLNKRNEEHAALKDELLNLRNVYEQTEKKYAQLVDDMTLMRTEVNNLRTERDVFRKDRENAADLRQELLQMHRLLNQERIKARALLDEMMTPMNVHRWRNLSGKDPQKMDLISRIQALRKQILSQNVVALEQERTLLETQHLYAALKEFMLKLPSHKIKAQLNEVKANLCQKDRKLKALAAELNMKATDEKTNSIKLEEIKTHLATAKTQLSEEKKKKRKLLEERQMLVQMQAQCFSAPPSMQRTLGAGFRMLSQF